MGATKVRSALSLLLQMSSRTNTSDEPLTFHGPGYTDGEELGTLNEEGGNDALGENLLRQILEHLALNKASGGNFNQVQRFHYASE